MFSRDERLRIDEELEKAEAARTFRNEGKARVCARRAAGEAIRSFLGSQNLSPGLSSAYDLLGYIQTIEGVPTRVKEAASLLRLRVNADHQIPVEADLLAEARILVAGLEQLAG